MSHYIQTYSAMSILLKWHFLSSKRYWRIMVSKSSCFHHKWETFSYLQNSFTNYIWHTLLKPNYNSPHSSPFPKRPKLPLSRPLFLYLLWLTVSPYDIFTQLKALSTTRIISMRNSSAPGCQHQRYNSTIPPTPHTHTHTQGTLGMENSPLTKWILHSMHVNYYVEKINITWS